MYPFITHKEREITSQISSYEINPFRDVAASQQLKEKKNKGHIRMSLVSHQDNNGYCRSIVNDRLGEDETQTSINHQERIYILYSEIV